MSEPNEHCSCTQHTCWIPSRRTAIRPDRVDVHLMLAPRGNGSPRNGYVSAAMRKEEKMERI